jgi:hydroxyacylglutathione hydrolase
MADIIQVLMGSDNFSYVIFDDRECAIVDPGADSSSLLRIIEERRLRVKFVISTHYHLDHTSSVSEVAERTGAERVASSYCAYRTGGADIVVGDGDILVVGISRLTVISTPGHTPGSICLDVEGHSLLTGDTLFIGDCGRCDLPGGNIEDMFESLQRLKRLPGGMMIYPGHDYGPSPKDTLSNQLGKNPCLTARDLGEFSRI